MAVIVPLVPATNTKPRSAPTATPRLAGGSVSSNTHRIWPVFASSAVTVQFNVATNIRPSDIVTPVWLVGPGSRVIHAPPSALTLLAVICVNVEYRWFVRDPP